MDNGWICTTYIDFDVIRDPSSFSQRRPQRLARLDQECDDVEQRNDAAFLARRLALFLRKAVSAFRARNAAVGVHDEDNVFTLIRDLGGYSLDGRGVINHGRCCLTADEWEANDLDIVIVGGQWGGEGVVEICW